MPEGQESRSKKLPGADPLPYLSIVSPVYRGEDTIALLVSQLIEVLPLITTRFEILLVDDGSPDQSWESICRQASKDPRIKGILLSRNFGQHMAITAGLSHARGEWVVVMDCDLQDRPEEILKLHERALEGYDIVKAQRVRRKDPVLKRITSRIFYAIFKYLADFKPDSSVANFGIYHRKVIDAVLSMGDQVRAFPVLLLWVGFNSTQIPVLHRERKGGKSTYSYWKLTRLALDVIFSFSNKPLHFTIYLGLFISFFSFIVGAVYLIKYFLGQILVPGYASLIISIWFLSGIIISSIGILGIYISKIFDINKNRPHFIVKTKLNLDEE